MNVDVRSADARYCRLMNAFKSGAEAAVILAFISLAA